jgi:hypothetical protein
MLIAFRVLVDTVLTRERNYSFLCLNHSALNALDRKTKLKKVVQKTAKKLFKQQFLPSDIPQLENMADLHTSSFNKLCALGRASCIPVE